MSSFDEDSSAGCAAVRRATRSDLPAILEIENREIRDNFAHFGWDEKTLPDLVASWSGGAERYPWLVAELDGKVVGFARAGPWKERESYRWTSEVGVYVLPEHQGLGIASTLYAQLFPALHGCGIKTVVAGIALPNEPSVRLHERFGMRAAGVLPKVGWKFGEWRDVGYLVLHFGGEPEI